MGLSDYLEKKLLDHVYIKATYTPPTTCYLALYTAAPTDAGGGTECAGGSYARQAITMNAATSPAGTMTNAAAISFTNMPACTVVAAGVFDAVSGGNLLHFDTISPTYTVAAGDNLTMAIGDLTLKLD